MKAVAIIAALLGLGFTATARAEVDPHNWCYGPGSLSPPLMTEQLTRAFFVARTDLLTAASFAPAQPIATLQMQPSPTRAVTALLPELGVADGAVATPMFTEERAAERDGSVLTSRGFLYCAPAANPDARSNAVCLGEVDDTTNIARFAHHARIDQRDGQQVGSLVMRRDRPLGRMRDWATLGEQQAQQPVSRVLSIEAIETRPQPAMFSTPAYDAVHVRFALEGFAPFTRRLGAPLRIDDGWLVVTGITSEGAATIERMTGEELRAFRDARCPR